HAFPVDRALPISRLASLGESPRRGVSTHYGAARSLPRGRLLEGGSPPPTAPRGRFRGGDSSKGVLHALRRRAVASAVRIRASTILLRSPRGRRSWWRRRSGGWGRGAASRRPPGTRRSGRGSS